MLWKRRNILINIPFFLTNIMCQFINSNSPATLSNECRFFQCKLALHLAVNRPVGLYQPSNFSLLQKLKLESKLDSRWTTSLCVYCSFDYSENMREPIFSVRMEETSLSDMDGPVDFGSVTRSWAELWRRRWGSSFEALEEAFGRSTNDPWLQSASGLHGYDIHG